MIQDIFFSIWFRTHDENDDDDDDENDENDEKGSADQGNNSVKLLNQQKREEFKKVEEDASQRKKLLDIEWRENKRKIDEELKRLKIEIEKRIRGEIETIETIGSGSIQQELWHNHSRLILFYLTHAIYLFISQDVLKM